MPDIKQRLIELICSTEYGNRSLIGNNFQKGFIERIADHIMASGFIEELQNEAYDLGVDSALHNHFGLSWEDAAGLRKEIRRIQDASRWISVTERLPEEGTDVLAYQNRGEESRIVPANYGREVWFDCFFDCEADHITHWMPLPEPPKGE
jgi:hypothetical protein